MFPQSPSHVTLPLQILFLHAKWCLDSFNHRWALRVDSFASLPNICNRVHVCAHVLLGAPPPSLPFFFFHQLVTSAGRPESNQGVFNTREERKTLET